MLPLLYSCISPYIFFFFSFICFFILFFLPIGAPRRTPTASDSLRQPTAAYGSLRQPTAAYGSLRQPTAAFFLGVLLGAPMGKKNKIKK
jgi:hypothetical protein